MSAVYLESSALVRVLLEGDAELARQLATAKRSFASALTFLECDRVVTRASLEKRLPAPHLAEVARKLVQARAATAVLALDGAILERARQVMPIEPVRTLGAIHLATLIFVREQVGPIALVSTDRRVRENAQALGFALVPSPG